MEGEKIMTAEKGFKRGAWDADDEGFYHCSKCNRALMIGGSLQDVQDNSIFCGKCLRQARQDALEEERQKTIAWLVSHHWFGIAEQYKKNFRFEEALKKGEKARG